MSVTVRIPTQLRELTGGDAEVTAEGATVADEDIRFLDGVDTDIPDGATLSIIPAVAGG